MKRFLLFVVALSFLTLGGCTFIPPHMALNQSPPDIVAPPGKALLVVAQQQTRQWPAGISVVVDSFLDEDFIGQTFIWTYFTHVVEPGEHYLYSYAENSYACPVTAAKFDFEAGKVYYVQFTTLYPPYSFTTLVTTVPFAPGDVDFSLLKYLDFNSNPGAIVLPDEDSKSAKDDIDNNPSDYADILNYKGF